MFVRKRDPRYKAHLKAHSHPAVAMPLPNPLARHNSVEPTAVYIEQEWQKTRVSGEEDLEWALAEGNDDPEIFECVACGKPFKSEAAWNSHERSKKHIKNVEVLRRQMEEEAMQLGLSFDPSGGLGPRIAEDSDQARDLATPPLEDGPDTEQESPRDTQDSPECPAKTILAEETLPEGGDEAEQIPSQEQKLSKREKRRLREARKQAQAVEDTHASDLQGRVDSRLTIRYRSVTFAQRNSKADRGCSTTSKAQATQSLGQSRTRAQKRKEQEESGSWWLTHKLGHIIWGIFSL